MQLKKSRDESSYPDTNGRYENQSYGVESTDSFSEFQGETQRRNRANANGRTEGDDRAQGQAKSESLVDRHSSFDGRYETDQDLRIEGTISGEVVCRGVLTIENEASARARIHARDAHIRGRLEGDVVCTGKLLLASTAVVTGTLKAPVLVVEEGASLSGSIDTTQKAGDIVSRSSKAATPATEEAAATPAREAASASGSSSSTRSRRKVPSFALVSSEAGATAERRSN